MIKKIFCLAVVGVVSLAGSAKATLYSDVNTYGSRGYAVTEQNPLHDLFDIGAHVFNPATEQAVSGVAVFAIADWNLFDKQETYTINLDGSTFAQGSFQFGVVLSGGVLGPNLLLTLNQSNGVLSYDISSGKYQDFRVLGAGLFVETCAANPTSQGSPAPGAPVPDGGLTLTLLGGGMLGICAFRRRR
ncbi:VPDSG-CTERM sorting domain-containing protein [bacterium]|nr:VPDSG-CTERM sorting domain-containing protein [bacterium]